MAFRASFGDVVARFHRGGTRNSEVLGEWPRLEVAESLGDVRGNRSRGSRDLPSEIPVSGARTVGLEVFTRLDAYPSTEQR